MQINMDVERIFSWGEIGDFIKGAKLIFPREATVVKNHFTEPETKKKKHFPN